MEERRRAEDIRRYFDKSNPPTVIVGGWAGKDRRLGDAPGG